MAQAKILIADDDDFVRDTVYRILMELGYTVMAVSGGQQAIETVREDFDVIILDIDMPDMNGFETMAALNAKQLDIPVLFLTGVGTLENSVKAINLGVYDFITKPVEDLNLFDVKIKRALEKRKFVLKERAYKHDLEKEVKEKTRELEEKNKLLQVYSRHLEVSTVNIIMTLQTALEEKDVYTAGHTTRVTKYASMIGKEMNLPEAELGILKRAAQLHDIGKLVIDSTSIEKPGPLTSKEWELVRKHPQVGENIVSHLGYLGRESRIIRSHHERLDGKGYPYNLKGDELDLLTKILTVADSYDAMTSKRCYKCNKTIEEAIHELQQCSGTQFDTTVVEVFASYLRNLIEP